MTKELKDVVNGFCETFRETPCPHCQTPVADDEMCCDGKVAEALRKVISDALREATTGQHVDRAIRASMILEDGLRRCGDE